VAVALMAMDAAACQPSIAGSIPSGPTPRRLDMRVVHATSMETHRFPKFGGPMGRGGRVGPFGSLRWSMRGRFPK
jgi:hypothetical protein